VGGSTVGEALIAGCVEALSGAGVAAGAAPHAVKITINPITLLDPKILKNTLSFIAPSLTYILASNFSAVPAAQSILSVYQRTCPSFQFLLNSYAFLRFLSGALGNLSCHSAILMLDSAQESPVRNTPRRRRI
jgi:hypothetical protein